MTEISALPFASIQLAEACLLSFVLADETGARARALPAIVDESRALIGPITAPAIRACRALAVTGSQVDFLAVASIARIDPQDLLPLMNENREGVQTPAALRVIGESWGVREVARFHERMVTDPVTWGDFRNELFRIDEAVASMGAGGIQSRIEAAKFDPTIEPPELREVFKLNGIPIATPGNLVAICAQAKAGKTAFLGAILGSTMAGAHSQDLLGLSGSNPDGKAVVHIDTEQSKADHWKVMQVAARRAGIKTVPPWIASYWTVGWSPSERRAALPIILRKARSDFHGIHSIFLDGVADFIRDPNDAEEAFGFVDSLQAMAVKLDCPITTVLHLNPGTEKSRGHLGSQLERRAETNLVLEKDQGTSVTVVYASKQRRAPILKADGPRFRWDGQAGMHVSIEAARAEHDAEEQESLRQYAADAYAESPARRMRYGDLVAAMKNTAKCAERTAELKIRKMRKHGIIREVPPRLLELAV